MWTWVGLAAIVGLVATFIVGLAKRYPWFILQSNLINGTILGPCAIGVAYGAYELLTGGGWLWIVLVLAAGIMVAVTWFNLRNSDEETRQFYQRMRSALDETISADE